MNVNYIQIEFSSKRVLFKPGFLSFNIKWQNVSLKHQTQLEIKQNKKLNSKCFSTISLKKRSWRPPRSASLAVRSTLTKIPERNQMWITLRFKDGCARAVCFSVCYRRVFTQSGSRKAYSPNYVVGQSEDIVTFYVALEGLMCIVQLMGLSNYCSCGSIQRSMY